MKRFVILCVFVAMVAVLGLGCGSKEVTVKMDPSKMSPDEKAQLEQMQKMQEQRMQMIVAPPANAAQQPTQQQAPGN